MFTLVCVQLKVLLENSHRFPVYIASITAAYLPNPCLPPLILTQCSILLQIRQVSDFLAKPVRILFLQDLCCFLQNLCCFLRSLCWNR